MVLTIGYWDFRALGEPVRLLLGYLDVKYEDKRYKLGATLETAREEWMKEKFSLGLAYPNLPYLIDGNTKITQSNAIMRYFGRKHDLLGKSEAERQKCDTTMDVAVDLQQELIKNVTSPTYDDNKEKLAKSLDDKLQILEATIGDKWIAGANITIADFKMFESLDEYRHLPVTKPIFQKYPKIRAYLQRFEAQPKIAKYMSSDRFRAWPLFPTFFNHRFEQN